MVQHAPEKVSEIETLVSGWTAGCPSWRIYKDNKTTFPKAFTIFTFHNLSWINWKYSRKSNERRKWRKLLKMLFCCPYKSFHAIAQRWRLARIWLVKSIALKVYGTLLSVRRQYIGLSVWTFAQCREKVRLLASDSESVKREMHNSLVVILAMWASVWMYLSL